MILSDYNFKYIPSSIFSNLNIFLVTYIFLIYFISFIYLLPTVCLSYFSIAVMKQRDWGHLKTKSLLGAYTCRGLASRTIMAGNLAPGRKAWLEQ